MGRTIIVLNAWQFEDEKISVPVAHGKQINCFGILARNNTFKYKVTTENINSIFLIDFFNEFVIDLKKPTVIVLDNAKIHHSKAFKSWIKYWQDRGFFFVYLPPLFARA